LMAYFRAWTPQFATGTVRTYANPSIGLLGVATARAMGQTFQALVEKRLFPELGLGRTYVTVPAAQQSAYAWGYDRADKPVRVNPGPLATEAYGIKSTAADMIRFVEVSMGLGDIPPKLRTALDATHVGYAKAGDLTQDLVWEQYPYPVALERIVAGNSSAMSLQPVPATMLSPPTPPRSDVIINKTGSTNGFGAYVAFVPTASPDVAGLAPLCSRSELRRQPWTAIVRPGAGTRGDHSSNSQLRARLAEKECRPGRRLSDEPCGPLETRSGPGGGFSKARPAIEPEGRAAGRARRSRHHS
jgi:beta-lactamase class C